MGRARSEPDWLIDAEIIWYRDQCRWSFDTIGTFFGHSEKWARRRYDAAKAAWEGARPRG